MFVRIKVELVYVWETWSDRGLAETTVGSEAKKGEAASVG